MKSFSKILLFVLLFGVNAMDAFCQLPSGITFSDLTVPPVLANSFRLDFAVPAAPAFQLLGSEPSTILRPSSVKEFGASFSSFINSSQKISIPGAFAIEFSPGLLIGGNELTLQGYLNKPWLYRLRLSAGTKRLEGETNPTQIAFGFRTSFIDKSDLRGDKELLEDITKITKEILKKISDDVPPPPPGVSGAEVVQPSSIQQTLIDSLNTVLKNRIDLAKANIDNIWNKDALDLAGALLFSAQDSLGKNLRAVKFTGWFTYAKGISSWGQWLLGFKAGTARDSVGTPSDSLGNNFHFSGSASTRLYIGSNSYKMFVEAQYSKQNQMELLLLNGGGEVRFRNGMWFSFGGGVERNFDLKEWNIVSKLTLNLGLPFL